MHISRKNIVVLCAILTVALILTVAALRSQGQNSQIATRNESPSPVQEGVKTEKQREHGKIFSRKYEYRRNKKLINLRGTGDLQVLIGIPTRNRPVNAPPFNLRLFLKDMICDSDAVLIGEVKDKSAQLTEYGEFAFTDYEITVEDVLKNNAAVLINPQDDITVTRPGGAIQLNGRIIRGIDLSYKPFASGSRILLFLKFIPATGAYETFRSDGSFALVGNELVKLTEEALPADLENEKDAPSFINKVRHLAVNTCSR